MKIRVLAVLAMFCLAAAGGASADEGQYTVGEFAVRLAKMMTQNDAYTPEDAQKLLRERGIEFDIALDQRVTEKLFVETLNQLGTNLTSANPERTLPAADANRILGMFDDMGGPGLLENHSGNKSIKCKSGPNQGDHCITDADCPGSFCNIPPGQAKKIVSPIDG